MISRLIRVPAMLFLCLAIPATAGAQEQAPAAAPGQPPAAAPAGERQPKRIRIDLRQVLAQARAAFHAGKLEEAIRLYQLILRFMPDSRAARLELSFALAALGESERASRLLRDIDRDGLSPDVTAAIDRILGPDRLKFFFIPRIIVDSNINGQTRKDVILINGVPFTLSEKAKGRDTYGYGFTLGAAWQPGRETPRTTLIAGLRVRDLVATRDDETELFGSASYLFRPTEWTTIKPAVAAAYRFKAQDPYESEASASLTGGFPVGPVRTTLSVRYRLIDDERGNRDSLDRERYDFNTGFGYGLPGLAMRFDAGVSRENWFENETQDHAALKTGLDFIFVKTPWATPTLGGSFNLRSFDNEAAFFDVKRLDRVYEGHVELLLRSVDLFGTKPFIRYGYRHATSNIPISEYNKHEFTVGVKAITF